MAIEHLSPTSSTETVAGVLERDGCCVIDGLAQPAALETVLDEMRPHIEATPYGPDEFSGMCTRRTGGLVARSPAARAFVMDPTVLAVTGEVLKDSTNFHLHLTQIIALGPGGKAQGVHRDQWAFDFFDFPGGYEVQCNALWAMTDFTEANGATRVIPGSNHAADKLRFEVSDTESAEMEAGSVFLYTGAVYHAGGENLSDEIRYGLNITYARAWLRQEENQYLTVPLETARTLDVELLKIMGYARGAYALGYIDDMRSPMAALFGDRAEGGPGYGFGDISSDELEEKMGFERAAARVTESDA